MQTPTPQGGHGHLSSADQADPGVSAYLAAMAAVRRLEAEFADVRAAADAAAARMDTTSGPARGRLGRVAAHLGVQEQSLKNQRQRARKTARRAAPGGAGRRMLTDAEYEAALRRAGAQADAERHQVPAPVLDAIVSGALHAVGLLAPPPQPESGTCTAQYADPEGEWWQCALDPGHAEKAHDSGGDWTWDDTNPSAVPARP